jgi:hypothetical protein
LAFHLSARKEAQKRADAKIEGYFAPLAVRF